MSLLTCITRAVQLGVLTDNEGSVLRQRYEGLLRDGMTNGEARDRMARIIKAEADLRERAALMTHFVIDRQMTVMRGYRDYKGRVDQGMAFVNMHENMGHEGSFVQDAEGRREAIVRDAMRHLHDLMREGRKGAFTGDLRRALPWVATRMDNVFREIHGTDTGDAKAKVIAEAWSNVAESLRVRFNDAGGAIGKLEGGYVPQSHDRLAVREIQKKPWVDFMMEDGRLDRKRMVDQATGEPLTDSELRQALEVSWERITTDGYYDADISTASKGKGALYTQHMDHRFIHFASPDKALEYSKRFGNGGDIYAAMMGHIQIMARDISHMEVLGPNPNRTREFIKSHLIAESVKQRSNEVVIAEQAAEMKRLRMIMNATDEIDNLIDEHTAIINKLDKLRSSPLGRRSFWHEASGDVQPIPSEIATFRAEMAGLTAELVAVATKIYDTRAGIEKTPAMAAAEAEMSWMLEHMREQINLAPNRPGDLAEGWVRSKIARADAMWDTMRGGEVQNPVWAARMQSVRNMVAAGSLGSAWLSSLTDPAMGQDVRLRMGQGIVKSNFARVAILTLGEMITMGKREDAIAAGFGIDAGMRVLHRHAREMKGWDHRFWTNYIADRVLTTGLLLPWTQAGKAVFDIDFTRWMGEITTTEWTALPASTRKTFADHGITSKDWTRLRLIEKKNGMLRPAEVIDADRDLGERYLQMILREQRHAIPEATVASSSILANRNPAGSLMGEAQRSMMQFKGFGFAMLMLHPLRIARELGAGDARGSAAAYAATLMITMTGLGMVAIALKDIKDGRDPRKWLDEKTWLDPFHVGEAILQAGGLGIFGDFIRASDNRMGGGLAGTIAGPLAGKAENIGRIAFPQASKYLRGKEITSEEELVRLIRSGTVPFSNHFLVSALYQRALMDNLQKMTDRNAYRSFSRKVNERQRDYNQGHWYPPGQTWPQRTPDLSRPFSTR